MTRALLLTFILAACATPVQYATPVVISMSDAEIVRRADGLTATPAAQTSTAGAVATANAQATATAVAWQFGVTQTSAAQSFSGTSVAMQIAEAQATDNARLRAAEIESARLSVTATAIYYAQQARLDETELKATRERWWVIWWSTVIFWILFLLALIVWVFVRAFANAVPQVRIALAAPPMKVIENQSRELPVAPVQSRLECWQEFLVAFCEFGEMAKSTELENTESFSERRFDLVGIERPLWEMTLDWLMGANVLTRVNRAKNSRAFWAGEWNLAELRRKVRVLDIPYPTDRDPPDIDFSVLLRAHAQPRTAAHTVLSV